MYQLTFVLSRERDRLQKQRKGSTECSVIPKPPNSITQKKRDKDLQPRQMKLEAKVKLLNLKVRSLEITIIIFCLLNTYMVLTGSMYVFHSAFRGISLHGTLRFWREGCKWERQRRCVIGGGSWGRGGHGELWFGPEERREKPRELKKSWDGSIGKITYVWTLQVNWLRTNHIDRKSDWFVKWPIKDQMVFMCF